MAEKSSDKAGRSRKALNNTAAAFLAELVSVVCGLILPKLILTTFGSDYNGIISSASRFISLISVLNIGISGAARAMLYEPLVKGDRREISRVIAVVERSARRIACALVVFAAVLALNYSVIIDDTFSVPFTSSLILIMTAAAFAKYFIALPYEILLYADQMHSTVSLIQAGNTALSTIFAAMIIGRGGTIHTVEFATASVSICATFCLREMARRKYSVTKVQIDSGEKLVGRHYALGQGISDYVNSNVDVVVLSVFAGLKQVSVYSVYAMVIHATSNMITNVISSFGAAFGNMHAGKEYDLMRDNMRLYELIVFSMASVIFSVTLSLIVPFVRLYTAGVTDVNYNVPIFAFILVLSAEFMTFRIPYETVSKAVGHFKQTRIGAYIEAGSNLVISVAGVYKFGLPGVAMGTLISAAVRSFDYAYYFGKKIIKRSFGRFVGNVLRCLAVTWVVYILSDRVTRQIGDWQQWILAAAALTVSCCILVLVIDYIFYRRDTKLLICKLCAAFGHGKRMNCD